MSGVAIVNLPSLDHTQIVSRVEAMRFHGEAGLLIIMEEDLLRFFSPQSCPSWTWSATSLRERSWPAFWTASPSWQVSYIKMCPI